MAVAQVQGYGNATFEAPFRLSGCFFQLGGPDMYITRSGCHSPQQTFPRPAQRHSCVIVGIYIYLGPDRPERTRSPSRPDHQQTFDSR